MAMTHPLIPEDVIPPDHDASAAEHELLDQLLREGLAIDQDAGATADEEILARARKLLEVLFNACIMRPLKSLPPSQVDLERAQLTLSIVARQTATHVEVLHANSTEAEEPFTVFAWLISRLLIAASRYEDQPGAAPLVESLCEGAVGVLVVLGRDLNEVGTAYLRGPQRVVNIMRELRKFARDSFDSKSQPLFGYPDMPTNLDYLPQLFALHIVLQTPAPLASDTHTSSAIVLSDLAQRVAQLSVPRQARYASVVAAAVPTVPVRHALSRACTAVVSWPEVDNARWQESVKSVIVAIEKDGDDALRRDVWWAIRGQAEALDVLTPVGRQKALYLLSPVAPHIPSSTISTIVSTKTLKAWAAEATGAGANDLRDRLKQYIKLPAPTSTKRKREENGAAQKVVALLQSKLPELEGDEETIMAELPETIAKLDPTVKFELIESTPNLLCALAHCTGEDYLPHHPLNEDAGAKWFAGWDSVSNDLTLMRGLGVLLAHTSEKVSVSSTWAKPLWRAWRALKSPDRRTRLAAGHLVSALYRILCVAASPASTQRAQREIIAKIPNTLLRLGYPIQETAMLLLGDLGQIAPDNHLGEILEILIKQLGSKSSPLRSLAYTQLVDIAAYRNKQPYNLLSPYVERISVLLAESLVPNPQVVAETMQFIGYNRQAFFTLEAARKAVIPTLVVRQNRPALETLSNILGQRLGLILIDEGAPILAQIFMSPRATTVSALNFVGSLLNELINSSTAPPKATLDKYIRASIVPLVVTIVIELGDEDESVQDVARQALHAVQLAEHTGDSHGDLGTFLKPHMLGVLAAMTEQLMTPRTPDANKRKVIRSIGKLISLVGDSMASFSPQIIASLQSTLDVPALRLQTLSTWFIFVELLKFADVGPFIGATIAALVAGWETFSSEEKDAARNIVALISGNAAHLQAFHDDIVRFDHIQQLKSLCGPLLNYRNSWTTKVYLGKLIERIDNKNIAISTETMRELRNLLVQKTSDIMQLARGDTFDPIVGRLVRSLLGAVTRDGECDELRDLAYECFGIIGALDPDRFVTAKEEASMTIMSNFNDHDESVNFALHLVRDLLVSAFRSTNDTKHQKNLSFSIQELLKFCGFDQRLVNRQGAGVNLKVRQRWETLPKDVLETVTPLLDAQFQQNQVKTTKFDKTIYPQMNTYREWVQAWTVDLIGRVMDVHQAGVPGDAQRIFGVFNSEAKNQDVAVAHHLLPHLVLHVLLSGDADAHHRIKAEIDVVLEDQVSPSHQSAPEKRMLSAQVVFDLMDHLGKWLRLTRNANRNDRSSTTRPVDQLLSDIDTELAGKAALMSGAFARSLRNIEECVVQLGEKNSPKAQGYFENMHRIYAELDDPDGMEGVSAFVVSPSLELQIREHESTGRWTSAQSCWEVNLQQEPENVKHHVGLLKCLKNLGHYDTLRTHIRGALSRHPEWAEELSAFQAEAAWTIRDWETLQAVRDPPPIANVFLAMRSGKGVNEALTVARKQIGSGLTTREYPRAYETVLQLHMLREVEMIYNTNAAIMLPPNNSVRSANNEAIMRRNADTLIDNLSDRFNTALPSFRVSEEILSKRRAAFSLVDFERLRGELGQGWIQSAKIARKAGYEQTAYSAALQSQQWNAPFAFIQQAKLVHMHGGILKALRELAHPIEELVESENKKSGSDGVIDLTGNGGNHDGPKTEEDFRMERNLAKALLLEARWTHEADRFEQNDVIRKFKKATELGATLEAPFFHLGRYYDTLASSIATAAANKDTKTMSPADVAKAAAEAAEAIATHNHFTCVNYVEALQRGVKYIYQTMPRLLTVWLDLGEFNEITKKNSIVQLKVQQITRLMERAVGKIMTYQFLTAFPQMISRITHSNLEVREVLVRLVYHVIRDYPAQALWPTIGAMQSTRKDRRDIAETILQKAMGVKQKDVRADLQARINDARKLSGVLLRLAEDKPEGKPREVSIATKYKYVTAAFPSSMIMPLQDALTCVLPPPGSPLKGHLAFPSMAVSINDVSDRVEIMPSLQQPKKLVFKGTDGKRYPFLCKPHDDLRKDARLMDFNSMINKFLNAASTARRRHLYIRTYAVMPLNEECGLIEWVSNTNALKSILEKGYDRYKKKVYSSEVHQYLEAARKQEYHQLPSVFVNKVLPMYRPTVFHEWFLTNWPEPSEWLTARTNYARTLAVMSMIGFVLGLGDRHGENILFDGIAGDTVHVDLNCLFDKARTFEVPERVPFRLTQNMVDALGVTGVDGSFRKAAEITMEILRSNGDSLMSVLQAFVHDPLVEWTKTSRNRVGRSDKDVKSSAGKKYLDPINKKLRGLMNDTEMTVSKQVEVLIKDAVSPDHLSRMYIGWAPWL